MRKTTSPDRHLLLKSGYYVYNRQVPKELNGIDPRFPRVRKHLQTQHLLTARSMRDGLEAADTRLWSALLAAQNAPDARTKYDAALQVREAYGLPRVIPEEMDLDQLRKGVKVMLSIYDGLTDEQKYTVDPVLGGKHADIFDALAGTIEKPQHSVTEAMRHFCEVIGRPAWELKSPAQKATWERPKLLAAAQFSEVCGDIPLVSITYDDALKFYEHLESRMYDKDDNFGYDAAKRQLGDMRQLFSKYCQRHRIKLENPFRDLHIQRVGKIGKKKIRATFSQDWIESKILKNPALKNMGAVRRHALMVIAQTGARPSEIINLQPSQVHLDEKIPYIEITTIEDGVNMRELKTTASIRKIPLHGVALAAMKKNPQGFPALFDKSNSFSAAVNKFMRDNGMMESNDHTLYSLRHATEDRLKAAGITDDMRRQILGHTIQRETYGTGYSLQDVDKALRELALKFDPAMV